MSVKSYEFWDFHEKAASYFGKIKGVLPSKFENNVSFLRNTKIYGYPNQFLVNKLSRDSQIEFQEHMKNWNFTFNQKVAYGKEISYGDYMAIKDMLDQTEPPSMFISALKDYFMQEKLKIILSETVSPIIILAHREPIKGNYSNGNDILKNKEVTQRGDILFTVSSNLNKYRSVKTPSFFSHYMITQFNLEEIPVRITRRKSVIGKNSNNRAVSNRQIILEKNRNQYHSLFEESLENLKLSVEDNTKIANLIDLQKEYERLKENPDWRKDM